MQRDELERLSKAELIELVLRLQRPEKTSAACTGTGVYCVVPSPSLKLDLQLVIPAVTADFLSSSGDVNLAE